MELRMLLGIIVALYFFSLSFKFKKVIKGRKYVFKPNGLKYMEGILIVFISMDIIHQINIDIKILALMGVLVYLLDHIVGVLYKHNDRDKLATFLLQRRNLTILCIIYVIVVVMGIFSWLYHI